MVGTLEAKFAADVKSEVTGVVTEVYVTEWVPVQPRRPAGAARHAARPTPASRRSRRPRRRPRWPRTARAASTSGRSSSSSTASSRRRRSTMPGRRWRRRRPATAAAQAQIRTAETRLAKSFITSPMDGIVALRGVSVGDRVENMGGNSAMFRIVDNRAVRPHRVGAVDARSRRSAWGRRSSSPPTPFPGRTFTGKVMFINPAIDAASQSAKVIVEVPNPDGALRDGAFVQGPHRRRRAHRRPPAPQGSAAQLEPRDAAGRRCSW